jgi:hypothetical protein
VSIQPLVTVTLCRCSYRVQVGSEYVACAMQSVSINRHRLGLLERGKISLRAMSVGRSRVTESSSEDSVPLGCDAVSSCVNFMFQS